MADGATTRYGYVKPEVGASADTWGTKINQVFDDLDAIGGAIITTGSGAAYVLTTGLSLAAYVAGQSFLINPSFTCNAAATVNVDGLGAKNITKNGTTATVSGDIVSGRIRRITYDGTQFQTDVSQSEDATTTALAALSWSSGNALVQFTAADTVSLTLAPSVTSVTATNATGATTAAGTFKNTTDAASVQALVIEGDRATMATNDTVYASWKLSNAAGTQIEFGRISVLGTVLTNGSEGGQMRFGVPAAGAMADRLVLSSTQLFPLTNDGITLGLGGFAFSDLFLASGGVINFNNGDVLFTHASNAVEVTGGGFAAPLLQVAGVGGETLAAATHRNRQLLLDGNITMPNATFAAGDWHVFTADGTNRTITRGASVTMYVNGVDSATATITARTTGGAVWETASVVHLTGGGVF